MRRLRGRGWQTALWLLLVVIGSLVLILQLSRLQAALLIQNARAAAAGGEGQAQALAQQAQRATPWLALAYTVQLAALHRNGQELVSASLEALRWMPADPYRWADFANVLVLTERYGPPLSHALTRVNTLAATSPALQRANVELWINHWTRGDRHAREQWLYSAEFVMTRQGRKFTRSLRRSGRDAEFCRTMGPHLELARWCEARFRE
jgi:hypothetical protein